MKTLFLFGGQGSQLPGMGLDLIKSFPETQYLFDYVAEQIPDLMDVLESESEDINLTKYTQPGIALFGAAMTEILKQHGLEPDAALGSSIGEFPALASLGVWSAIDMLDLAIKRGSLMAEKLKMRQTSGKEDGMSAIIGLDFSQVEAVLESESEFENVWISNINTDRQIVLAGAKTELEELEPKLKEAGSRRIVPLKVEGAFHTPIFTKEAEQFRNVLDSKSAYIPVRKSIFLNRSATSLADLYEQEEDMTGTGKQTLSKVMAEQMCNPVEFYQCQQKTFEQEFDLVVEISAKPVLASLIHKELRKIKHVKLDSAKAVQEFLTEKNFRE
ncbi:MAG: ACP S-malonyltransferase [Clostridiaceae bacterium]|nr:ACP S-malonyltransferase [Clostridiaceae bacterium]